ncbi:TPA: hypothetical protein DCR85_02040 [Candidatus Moranbacteria bacterium]|nr:hypothetical protein [Candidatus Moranbacteria bacterium]HBI50572.1 hypothetical protein [Candidatus Moranbacteria bacterium]
MRINYKNMISGKVFVVSALIGIVLTFFVGYWQANFQLNRQKKEMVEMSKQGTLGEIEANGGFPLKFLGYGLTEKFNVLNFIIDAALMTVIIFIILK